MAIDTVYVWLRILVNKEFTTINKFSPTSIEYRKWQSSEKCQKKLTKYIDVIMNYNRCVFCC